jgi:N-acetylglucosaminyldiphosphoundecaprenol N-acetyl-beta-D-mannosaminyltransferase
MNSNPLPGILDDLSRNVYCILGVPIDAIDMPAVLQSVDAAVASETRFLLSTANLNFLVNSQMDPEFRESLLLSDLCSPDGMPLVWIARLVGIPIKRRVAGSDIFEALKWRPYAHRPLKVFIFGATEEVAAAAARRVNESSVFLKCVGWSCPGFVNLDALSDELIIDQINSSNADFLMAALGAHKGQLWMKRNHFRLRIPVRAHLGATINFQAGVIRRAPPAVRKIGLEWLWRIKEEPKLWRRYWYDGGILLRMFVGSVLPLAVEMRLAAVQGVLSRSVFAVQPILSSDSVVLRISGYATVEKVDRAIPYFREAVASGKQIVIDLFHTQRLDARFLGLILMLRKQLAIRGDVPKLVGATSAVRRQFRLNGVEYLLS